MRIILAIIVVIISGCSSGPVVTIAKEPASYAWWLRLNANPLDTSLRGIPIKDINPAWVAAYEFRKEDIPSDLLNSHEKDIMSSSNVSFSLEGEFNNDGISETALVGVYRDNENKKGNFLLVLSQADENRITVSFIDTFTGGGDFIAIDKRSKNGIDVWFCMYCNHGASFKWIEEKGTYEFQKQLEGKRKTNPTLSP